MAADFKDIAAKDVEEGNEIFNGARYLVVEDAQPVGGNIRIEAEGISWELDPERQVRIAA